jgi:hypothetical protein
MLSGHHQHYLLTTFALLTIAFGSNCQQRTLITRNSLGEGFPPKVDAASAFDLVLKLLQKSKQMRVSVRQRCSDNKGIILMFLVNRKRQRIVFLTTNVILHTPILTFRRSLHFPSLAFFEGIKQWLHPKTEKRKYLL